MPSPFYGIILYTYRKSVRIRIASIQKRDCLQLFPKRYIHVYICFQLFRNSSSGSPRVFSDAVRVIDRERGEKSHFYLRERLISCLLILIIVDARQCVEFGMYTICVDVRARNSAAYI